MPDDEPLFIVDNAPGGRSGLAYLAEWCELATSFDIATGFFDLGSLLALDGKWQQLQGMRILMGGDVGAATRRALLKAVKERATAALDDSVEVAKEHDPFLEGADAVVDALAKGTIVCRVYDRDKFHAKAYITHGKFDVLGSQALVGSSNFTRAGLTQNVELNLKVESSAEVAQLQRWYERHWELAVDVTPDVLTTIKRHTREFSPFEVYAKSLQSLVAKQDPSSSDWDRNSSKMFGKLDRYQQEAYHALIDIAKQHRGALLCDGVGLGKTYVGLQLIERLVLREGKRVVLLAPKAVREGVWEKELRNHLAHIGGFGGTPDFSNLTVFNHTDLTRGGDFPERFDRIAALADVVVIDEAHHFRNRGRLADPNDPNTWSRYHRLGRLIGGRPKDVYLLTATPINNSLNDFRHLVELFTGGDDAAFSRTLGVPSVTARLNAVTRHIQQQLNAPDDVADAPDLLQDVLAEDPLFQGLVVQRSRAYARESQILERGEATAFPERLPPEVAAYSLRKSHGRLIELLDESFERDQPLFSLAVYYPLAFYTGPDTSIDPKEENRQKQVVGLIRTNFLKRFESSVFAFQRSCDRLMRRLLAFLEVNMATDAQKRTRERWVLQHQDLLDFVAHRQLELLADADADDDDDEAEDLVPPELLEAFEPLPTDEYDVAGICQETFLDLDQIAKLLDATRRFSPKDDDKLRKLIELVTAHAKEGRKTLVFTEFADTARYLEKQLAAADVSAVEELDGSRGKNRADVIERFSPYYNGTTSGALADEGRSEIQVLVTTDVLAEGLNLQDATRLVNYDIHWNPVRLMQRIGRVDRRLNPAVEAELIADHPELADDRGVVAIHNFLPPDELEVLLRLYEKVTFKTLLISKTLGIEGGQFLEPDDDFQALVEFNAAYEGTTTESEVLHLEFQQLLAADPSLEAALDALPKAVFSGRRTTEDGTFLCYELPALDTELGQFTLEAGTTRWYLHRHDGTVVEDTAVIARAIRSNTDTPRDLTATRPALLDAKKAVEQHVRNTYLKALDVPLDAPEPKLVGWMDLSA